MQGVIINAPLEAVWSYSMDLTKIPEFHPRVVKVDLLSGKTLREPGASYRCHLAGGKHTCIEKDIEIIPLREDRHCVAGGRIRYQQDSQRLQSGNDVLDARPSVNQGAFILDGLQMFTQPVKNFFPFGIAKFLPKFIEREVDDVVVMNLLRGYVIAKFKPNAVEQVNLLGREVRCMRPEIKDMLLTAREENLECQLWLGIG